MYVVEINKMLLTKASTLRLREKQEERGRLKTLNNIPLRSMLFNAGRDTVKRLATVSKRNIV